MTQYGDHERQMEEQEEVEYDFGQEDAIGQEMADLREKMREADVASAWVPPPSGLETYPGLGGRGTNQLLYLIGAPDRRRSTLAGYCTYVDTRGRDVLPLFSSIEGARAYVDSEAGFATAAYEPVDLHEAGGTALLVEILLRVDLVVIDPDPIPHPGRCATSEPGWSTGFTAADLNELHRLRGVARVWSERRAEEEFGGAEISGEDYEYLRLTLEHEYMESHGDVRRAEDSAWSMVHNAIDMDRTLSLRSAAREARQLQEFEQYELSCLEDDIAADAQDQLNIEDWERGIEGRPPREGDGANEIYRAGVEERERQQS